MRDFGYSLAQIGNANLVAPGKSSLVRYFKFDNSAFAPATDYSQYGRNSSNPGSYNPSAPGLPAAGYLLDQHGPTSSFSFQNGHGFGTLIGWNGKQDSNGAGGYYDDFINQSWSLVFAGLKPHDMTVDRSWHGIGSGADIGGTVTIKTDGTLTVTSNVANPVSSAAGVIKRFVPHLIIMSYDNVGKTITVYVGDWTGRWVTAIDHAVGAAITTSGPYPLIGRNRNGSPVAADGFLDDYAVYIGHAITSPEATALFAASGYQTNTLTYNRTLGHRNGPLNCAYPTGQKLDSTSAAAVSELANKADSTQINGAGGFNYYQFDTSFYVVSKAFRQDPANWQKISGPNHYGDQSLIMQFEDVPVPFGGRPNAATTTPKGFAPAAGSDAHLCVYCPETDEYWETGGSSGYGADPNNPTWSVTYGTKQTNMSLFIGAFPSGTGATATGIPNMLGLPTVVEIQNAIYNGIPIPHGLAGVMFDGLAAHVWPANRHDGGKGAGTSSVMEGQLFRLKHDAATTAAIAAMPHPTGRAMAQAAQTYGILLVDKNVYATLLQIEDSAQYTNASLNPYGADPAGKPALGGILNGQQYSVNTMQGFPWSSLELLDNHAINPGDPTQTVRPAVTGLNGTHTGSAISLTWPDDPLAQYWNIYQKVGSTYTKIANSYWPQYTVWNPLASMTFAITAINGAGESTRSIDFTPPLPNRSRRRNRTLVG